MASILLPKRITFCHFRKHKLPFKVLLLPSSHLFERRRQRRWEYKLVWPSQKVFFFWIVTRRFVVSWDKRHRPKNISNISKTTRQIVLFYSWQPLFEMLVPNTFQILWHLNEIVSILWLFNTALHISLSLSEPICCEMSPMGSMGRVLLILSNAILWELIKNV